MTNKGRSSRSKRTPPQAPNSIRLDALPEKRGPACALHLQCCFEGVDGREDHAEGGCAVNRE